MSLIIESKANNNSEDINTSNVGKDMTASINLKEIDSLIDGLNNLEQFLLCIGLKSNFFSFLQTKSIHNLLSLKQFILNGSLDDNKKFTEYKHTLLTNLELILAEDNLFNISFSKIRNFDFLLSSDYALTTKLLLEGNKLKTDSKSKTIPLKNVKISYLNNKNITSTYSNAPFTQLNNLRFLFLSNNKIQRIELQGSFPYLNTLDLSNNFIKNIENIDHMAYLETLNLSENLILKIENLQNNISLLSIDLSKQKLTQLQHLVIDNDSFPTDNFIEQLLIHSNKIQSISSLSNLLYLKKLNISYNDITEWSILVEMLKSFRLLEDFTYYNNPFCSNRSYQDEIISICPALNLINDRIIKNNEKEYVGYLLGKGTERNKRESKFDNFEVLVPNDFYFKQIDPIKANKPRRKVLRSNTNNIFPTINESKPEVNKKINTEIGLALGNVYNNNHTTSFIPSSKVIGSFSYSNKSLPKLNN